MSQGRVPICPGEGSRLSQGRFLFVPDTVPPKMFMFIGFFLARSMNFPLFCFYVFFAFLCFFFFPHFPSFFSSFSKDKSKQLQFTGTMGHFTPTPCAPTPFRTSRYRGLSGVFSCLPQLSAGRHVGLTIPPFEAATAAAAPARSLCTLFTRASWTLVQSV